MAQISVLMSVYNVEAYVAQALVSIQSQTFSDLEIVVVDDGSTDGTLLIVDRMASADPRVKVVRSAKNQGLSLALNLGLKFCTSPYIARMDGDDIALPNRLEKQLRFLEMNPDIALVGCETVAIDLHGYPLHGLGISRKPITPEAISRTMLIASPCLHIWLARREVYDALSGCREMSAEDYDFLLRSIIAGYRSSNLPEALMQIRTRPGQTSERLEQKKADSYIVKLYRERLRCGQDSFSREGYERFIKPGRIENVAFHLAQKCVRRGLRLRSRILRYFLIVLASLISPWQARYYFDRIRFRAVLWASMRLS